MKRTGAMCAMALASMAAVGLPAAADAKKLPYKQATFKATLSGSQVSTWEYNRPNDKDDPCDASAQGNGSQQISFDAKRTFRITFRTPPKGQPNLYNTDGRPAVFATPFRLPVDAVAEREGQITTNAGDIGPDCGDNGGADPDYVPPVPDCGKREGGFAARFYFHDPSQDEDDLLVPIVPGTEKNALTVAGTDYEWSKPGSDDGASELRNTYERCPFYGEYPPDAGQIYLTSGKIKEASLFNKKRKKLVVSADTTSTETMDNTTTKTLLAWNLRLKRIK